MYKVLILGIKYQLEKRTMYQRKVDVDMLNAVLKECFVKAKKL